MTGPAYPPPPAPGSNALGVFTLGVSPLGTIPQFNVWNTIASQYGNSDIITSIIQAINDSVDPTVFLDSFYDNIWNPQTAVGIGLDIWGRIVGVSRFLNVPTSNWFGFAESLPGAWTFGQGTFYSGQATTGTYALSDDAFRQLIFAKAAANLTDGSIPSINSILLMLFPNRGNCYVKEGSYQGSWFGFAESQNAQGFNQAPFYTGQALGSMTMTYVFNFQLSPVEIAIVEQSNVLPRSTGVAASVLII